MHLYYIVVLLIIDYIILIKNLIIQSIIQLYS